MVLGVAGCFYIPRPLDEVNAPPRLIVPAQGTATFWMIGPENPAEVVVQDADGDRLTAFWQVPGYPGPLDTRQIDTGALTKFVLVLPRLEQLHDQVITVTIVDDDPDDPKTVGVEFTVKVQ